MNSNGGATNCQLAKVEILLAINNSSGKRIRFSVDKNLTFKEHYTKNAAKLNILSGRAQELLVGRRDYHYGQKLFIAWYTGTIRPALIHMVQWFDGTGSRHPSGYLTLYTNVWFSAVSNAKGRDLRFRPI